MAQRDAIHFENCYDAQYFELHRDFYKWAADKIEHRGEKGRDEVLDWTAEVIASGNVAGANGQVRKNAELFDEINKDPQSVIEIYQNFHNNIAAGASAGQLHYWAEGARHNAVNAYDQHCTSHGIQLSPYGNLLNDSTPFNVGTEVADVGEQIPGEQTAPTALLTGEQATKATRSV